MECKISMGLEIKKWTHYSKLYVLPPELFADTHYLSPGEFIFLVLALDFKMELQPLSDSNPQPHPTPTLTHTRTLTLTLMK